MHEIVDTEVSGMIEYVVQVRGFDFKVDIPAFRGIAIPAIAADAGRHALTHVRGEEVGLIRRRAGIHVGRVVAALRVLTAI